MQLFTLFYLISFMVSGQMLKDVAADSVVAYEYVMKAGKHVGAALIENRILRSKTLTAKTVDHAMAILNASESYGDPEGACFDSRQGLVWYRDGSPVGQVSICFDCNNLRVSHLLEGRSQQVYPNTGFSKQGWTALRDMCRSFDFQNCPENRSSIFD